MLTESFLSAVGGADSIHLSFSDMTGGWETRHVKNSVLRADMVVWAAEAGYSSAVLINTVLSDTWSVAVSLSMTSRFRGIRRLFATFEAGVSGGIEAGPAWEMAALTFSVISFIVGRDEGSDLQHAMQISHHASDKRNCVDS